MNETIHIPKQPLNQFVDAIWIGKADEYQFQDKNRALLLTELIFNFGGTFHLEGENVWTTNDNFSKHTISGLKTSPFKLNIGGKYSNVGLVLKPYCYGLLHDTFGTGSMSVISDILFEYLIFPEKPNFNAIEKHLTSIFLRKELDTDLIKFENHISTALLRKGFLSDFNASVSISQKSFIQKFKKNYLLTPNQYIKLKQVDYAVQIFKQNDKLSLTHVGLESGFYDQPHFIRVFKQFCGVTPGKFLKSGGKSEG